VAILKFNPLLYRSEIVSQVERITGGLNSR